MSGGERQRGDRLLGALCCALFVLLGAARAWEAGADDLSSIYIAAAVQEAGAGEHLYAHDPEHFAAQPDRRWHELAAELGFSGALHPYVHLPLLATALGPVVRHVGFRAAAHALLLLNLGALVGSVLLIGGLFVPAWRRWEALGLVLALLLWSEPVRYALWLGQTTPLVLSGVLAAVALDRRGHPVAAGLGLAVVIALKLTPILLLAHFAARRRRGTLVATLGWGALIVLLSLALCGPAENLAYVRNLRRISAVTLTAFNNQSLAAWLARRDASLGEVFRWVVVPLPALVRWGLTAALLALTAAVAAAVRRAEREGGDLELWSLATLLLLPLLLATISWSHYFLLLLPAVAALLHPPPRASRGASRAVAAMVVALNLPVLAANASQRVVAANLEVNAHLLSALLAAAALVARVLPGRARHPARASAPGGGSA